MRQYFLSLGLAVIIMTNVGHAGPDIDSLALDENKITQLRSIVTIRDKTPTAEDIAWMRGRLVPDLEPVNMYAALYLYNLDTAGFRDALFEYFTVHDYADRSIGKQKNISRDEFIAAVKKIEEQLPEDLVKKNLVPLYAYWYFRDRNEWFPLGENELISAARFFRTASLTAYLKLSSEDAMALAARLDKAAQNAARIDKEENKK
jgi:hypothetical protein